MKTRRTLILAVSAIAGLTVQAVWAQEPHRAYREKERQHEAFALGVCVGKTLTQQGVNIPVARVGQPTPLDDATRSALHDAVDQCRAEMIGEAPPSPSPSVAPSVAPTAVPSTPAIGPTTEPSIAPSPVASAQMGR